MWNARRIEIGQNGQNGQNGHALESEGDLVPTQMKCFLKCLVSAMECLCRCLTSQQNSLHYTALIKVRVECPPHWNRTKRTKRTKRTLTGIGRRLRVHPNELLFNALGIGKSLCICATSQNQFRITLLWLRLRLVWNAHRIEIGQNGQNGQNGHSLESEGDFVFTQIVAFLRTLYR